MIHLTREQVRQVDRRAIDDYHIPGIVLMENAARGTADAAMEMLAEYKTSDRRLALILCGPGNNGGDGLAIARHLHNRRVDVCIGLCADAGQYSGDALINWRIVQAMNLPCQADFNAFPFEQASLIIDAIFGTGLSRPPRAPFDEIAQSVAASRKPVLAVDLPSGLDCDTGAPLGPCIAATRTVTFVAMKAGFANPAARRWTGEVTVADIGCPIELIELIRNGA